MNSEATLLVALVSTAFIGSWHCGVMCGPIACFAQEEKALRYYHIGRFMSYGLIGIVAGFIGSHFTFSKSLPAKIIFFLLFAALIVFMYFLSQKNLKSPNLKNSIHKKLMQYFMRLSRQSHSKFFGFWGIGILTVFLPCGWLMSYILAAAATQSPWAGFLVMGLFSLSAIPALSAFPILLEKMIGGTPGKYQKYAQVVIVISSLYALFSHLFI